MKSWASRPGKETEDEHAPERNADPGFDARRLAGLSGCNDELGLRAGEEIYEGQQRTALEHRDHDRSGADVAGLKDAARSADCHTGKAKRPH